MKGRLSLVEKDGFGLNESRAPASRRTACCAIQSNPKRMYSVTTSKKRHEQINMKCTLLQYLFSTKFIRFDRLGVRLEQLRNSICELGIVRCRNVPSLPIFFDKEGTQVASLEHSSYVPVDVGRFSASSRTSAGWPPGAAALCSSEQPCPMLCTGVQPL